MTESVPIRVGIADDNDDFRDTLSHVLQMEPDFQVVGSWCHGLEVIAGLEAARPDVLLLDINMPLMSGVEATKRLQEVFPEVRIIILSMHDEASYVLETLRSGASGYLVKDGSVAEIVQAIREVSAGRAIVHPAVTHSVLSHFQEGAQLDDSWQEVLTDREMDVLRELGRGKSNEDIALTLHITVKTVKNHVSNILQKLYVTDRTQAVLVALRKRWISA